MLIDFNAQQERRAPGMNSGTGIALCDGEEEFLSAGNCHVCKKGSEHSIMNTGNEDLVMLTVVVER